MKSLSFRQFMELVQTGDSYIGALGQLGVDPDSAVEGSKYTANFVMNGKFFTAATFTIKKLLRDGKNKVTGAIIELDESQPEGVFKQDAKGRWVQYDGYRPGRETGNVDRKTLEKMLNPEAGLPMAPGAGAMGGQPPMGGGLPGM